MEHQKEQHQRKGRRTCRRGHNCVGERRGALNASYAMHFSRRVTQLETTTQQFTRIGCSMMRLPEVRWWSEQHGRKNSLGVQLSEGPKGGRRKGGRSRKLSHFSFCCAFRCCVVYSPCFPVWGEEKVMTIYDAGPLAAGPLCGLLKLSEFRNNSRNWKSHSRNGVSRLN